MNDAELTPAGCAAIRWDVVVVGSGMGGATLGYELARMGRRVLFIEKGSFLHAGFRAAPAGIAGSVVGSLAKQATPNTDEAQFLAQGRWPHRARAIMNIGKLEFRVPVGCTSGGSSAFYAAALERFSPADFSPAASFRGVAGSALPEHWPISYQELEPFYEQAETLFRVRGAPDPLHAGSPSRLLEPPALNPRDQNLLEDLQARGLHPYRVHVGCDFIAGCDGCPHGPCERGCKQDSAWACLIPALQKYHALMLPDCEVQRLEADASAVHQLVCLHAGTELRIQAQIVVLAAGAFATPSLLLRSRSAHWPDGIGNHFDLVGRHLMFHGGNLVALSPSRSLDHSGIQKTLALNDFYSVEGEKLGTFQTLGVSLDIGHIMLYLRESAELSTAWWKGLFSPRPVWWRKLTSPFVRLGAMVYFYLYNFKHASVWVSIIEDLPYRHNRVYPDPKNSQNIVIEYEYSTDLKERVARFRAMLTKALGSLRFMVLSTGDKIDYPHVCGTCRFGDDSETSVLDRNCRVHDVANLYVVDASFFPSSGGTNPSLTIAANALRVAQHIHSLLPAITDTDRGKDAN